MERGIRQRQVARLVRGGRRREHLLRRLRLRHGWKQRPRLVSDDTAPVSVFMRLLVATMLCAGLLRASRTSVQPATLGMAVQARSFVSSVLLTSDAYETKQVAELRALLRQRELATAGRKGDLVQRLKQNDMQRAGSTLALNAPKDPSRSTRGKPAKAKAASKDVPKGEAAAELAAAKLPAAPLDPGSVSSPTKDLDGKLGKSSPPMADNSPNKPTSPPGRPAHKAEELEEVFKVTVPYEEPPVVAQHYIPSIKAYAETSQDYSDSYKEDWHMPHVPRVHAVGMRDTLVSHNATVLGDEEMPRRPTGSILREIASDLLPPGVIRQVQAGLQTDVTPTGTLRSILDDLKSSIPAESAGSEGAGHARPSPRRALTDEERHGAYILGGIVLTGFLLGGLANTGSRHGRTTQAVGYQAPHYVHGGNIVGAGIRKV